MTSPVSQSDLKLSLFDRVERKLNASEANIPDHQAAELTAPLDETNLCYGDRTQQLDRAILSSPQDENDNTRNVDGCGDMEISTGETSMPTMKPPDMPVEPPIEERITMEDFDLPFDDDAKENRIAEVVDTVVEKPADKQKISLEDLHLPFDNDPPTDNSPALVTVPSNSKRGRRRKKSADFEIITTDVLISPDVQLPEVPNCRRSSRIRRKSTELNRSRIQYYEPEAVADDFESIDLTEPSSVDDLKLASAGVNTMMTLPNTDNQQIPMEEGNVALENHSDNSTRMDTSDNTKTQTKPKGRNKRKCTIPTKENSTPAKKAKTNPKNEPGPCLEDIYMNRLWRAEMPTEKTWETIYEEPKINLKGKKANPRPQKRILDPDEFYTQAKLKRRRNKAIKQGYKPLSKKRLQKAETLLLEKLSIFEQDLESDETNSVVSSDVAGMDNVAVVDNLGVVENVAVVENVTRVDHVDLKDLQISHTASPEEETTECNMEET